MLRWEVNVGCSLVVLIECTVQVFLQAKSQDMTLFDLECRAGDLIEESSGHSPYTKHLLCFHHNTLRYQHYQNAYRLRSQLSRDNELLILMKFYLNPSTTPHRQMSQIFNRSSGLDVLNSIIALDKACNNVRDFDHAKLLYVSPNQQILNR